MKKEIINYNTLLNIMNTIVLSRDPEEVALLAVESVKTALEVKGCALLLFNRKTGELELASSIGLSERYINKGPLSSTLSIADSLKDGPVAIDDVTDDQIRIPLFTGKLLGFFIIIFQRLQHRIIIINHDSNRMRSPSQSS